MKFLLFLNIILLIVCVVFKSNSDKYESDKKAYYDTLQNVRLELTIARIQNQSIKWTNDSLQTLNDKINFWRKTPEEKMDSVIAFERLLRLIPTK
jgi:hypothetical protein